MSGGGWELVARNRKEKNGKPNGKLSKAEKKRFIENAPKVEDFLPLTQVKTLYDNLDSNKENKKPEKEKENKTKENQEKKKQQQKQQQQQKQPAAEPKKQKPKEKPPKSIKDGLNMINVEELNEVLSASLARFPDAPLVWLRDLYSYLNLKLPGDKEDAVFSGQSYSYPLCLVPEQILKTLDQALDMAGPRNEQLFFENSLANLPGDMVKGLPVVGQKLLLQLLAKRNPDVVGNSIGKLISARNSYQNRKPVGLSLLWLMAQAGWKDLSIGLKVWHEVMASMIEVKGYSSYVIKVLNDMAIVHENSTLLTPEIYLEIIEDLYSGKINIPTTIARDIENAVNKLRSILFKNKNISYTKLFGLLMGRINQKIHASYRDELIKTIVGCLSAEPLCFSSWRSIYAKNLYQSQLLLTYIHAKWSVLRTTLKPKCLKETCIVFQTANEKWKKGRDENLAQSCSKLSQAILTKMTATKQQKFPWGKASVLLAALIAAVVAYDLKNHGSFEASSTGRFLRRSGVAAYVEKAQIVSEQFVSASLATAEARYPQYYKTVVDTCKPYGRLVTDLYIVSVKLGAKLRDNVAAYIEKGPIVPASLEPYVSDLVEQVRLRSAQGAEIGKEYLTIIVNKVSEHSSATFKWLEHNVFVGKLSPENLQSYATHAIDTTQTLANQMYDWVCEVVESFSKMRPTV